MHKIITGFANLTVVGTPLSSARGFVEINFDEWTCTFWEDPSSTQIPLTIDFGGELEINLPALGKMVRVPEAFGEVTGSPVEGFPAKWSFSHAYESEFGTIPDSFDELTINMQREDEFRLDPPAFLQHEEFKVRVGPNSLSILFSEPAGADNVAEVEESFWAFVQIIAGETIKYHRLSLISRGNAVIYRNMGYSDAKLSHPRHVGHQLGIALPYFKDFRRLESQTSGNKKTLREPLSRLAYMNEPGCGEGVLQLTEPRAGALCSVAESITRAVKNPKKKPKLSHALEFLVDSIIDLLAVDPMWVKECMKALERRRHELAHEGVMPFVKNVAEHRINEEVARLVIRAFVMRQMRMPDDFILQLMHDVCVRQLERIFKLPGQ